MAKVEYVHQNGAESRYEKERADRLEMENKLLRGELLSISEVTKVLIKGFGEIKQFILDSSMEPSDADALLENLAGIKKNVASSRPLLRSLYRRNVSYPPSGQ